MAWSAFYDDGYSLRISWCIGRQCEDLDWDNQEEEVDDEVTEQSEQLKEQQEQVERSEVADIAEELIKHSSELSSYVAAPFLPSSQLPMSCENSGAMSATFWRPCEDPYKDKAADGDVATSQKSLVTPQKPYFSSALFA